MVVGDYSQFGAQGGRGVPGIEPGPLAFNACTQPSELSSLPSNSFLSKKHVWKTWVLGLLKMLQKVSKHARVGTRGIQNPTCYHGVLVRPARKLVNNLNTVTATVISTWGLTLWKAGISCNYPQCNYYAHLGRQEGRVLTVIQKDPRSHLQYVGSFQFIPNVSLMKHLEISFHNSILNAIHLTSDWNICLFP